MDRIVSDLMTRETIVVRPETPIGEAISLFAKYHISGMPVVNDRGKLVGTISATDLMWREKGIDTPLYILFLDGAICLQNPFKQQWELHKVLGQTVKEVMTPLAIGIAPDRPLASAAKIMTEKQVRRLPVVLDDGQLVGIISQGDIVRAMCQELSETIAISEKAAA
jgi:CBS domain-containing protein